MLPYSPKLRSRRCRGPCRPRRSRAAERSKRRGKPDDITTMRRLAAGASLSRSATIRPRTRVGRVHHYGRRCARLSPNSMFWRVHKRFGRPATRRRCRGNKHRPLQSSCEIVVWCVRGGRVLRRSCISIVGMPCECGEGRPDGCGANAVGEGLAAQQSCFWRHSSWLGTRVPVMSSRWVLMPYGCRS